MSLRMKRVCDCERLESAVICLLLTAVFPSLSRAQAPVFKIVPSQSSIKFDVKASIDISGKFDKWNANLTFTSPDETTGALEIKVDAGSVDTGSGMKNGKLKGKDFFDVEKNPQITFRSTKFVQTGPDTFEVDGDFMIRGVSNTEKLTLVVPGKGTGSSEIKGKMVFNRKDYGMNKGIPFIKIADHVEVDFDLKAKRVSGPLLAGTPDTQLYAQRMAGHSNAKTTGLFMTGATITSASAKSSGSEFEEADRHWCRCLEHPASNK